MKNTRGGPPSVVREVELAQGHYCSAGSTDLLLLNACAVSSTRDEDARDFSGTKEATLSESLCEITLDSSPTVAVWRLFPQLDKSFLSHILGKAVVPQDTQCQVIRPIKIEIGNHSACGSIPVSDFLHKLCVFFDFARFMHYHLTVPRERQSAVRHN